MSFVLMCKVLLSLKFFVELKITFIVSLILQSFISLIKSGHIFSKHSLGANNILPKLN